MRATSTWGYIETWTGTLRATAAWKKIETWNVTISAPYIWRVVDAWTGTVRAPSTWNLVDTWAGTLRTSTSWKFVESWTGSVWARAIGKVIDTWTGTVRASAQFNIIETWTGALRAPAAWKLIETWTGAVRARGVPSSSVDTVSPYWRTSVLFTVTATASDPSSSGYVVTVTLRYRYSANKSSWGAWDNFGTDNASPWSWSFSAPSGDGYYEFYSIAVDEENNVESAPDNADTSCGVDTVNPVITSVAINDGSQTTSSTSVTINIVASDSTSGVVQMQFSNDNTTWTDWETFATSRSYTLPSGDGVKTVHVRVRDNAGLVSVVASGSIELKTAPAGFTVVGIGNIPAGGSKKVDLTSKVFWVTSVTITTKGGVTGATIAVEQRPIESLPVVPGGVQTPIGTGTIYPLFWEIETNIDESLISSVKLEFKIERYWLSQNNIDEKTITMFRFSGGWQELPTQYLGADESYFYYEAYSPGASIFVVVGTQRAAKPVTPVPAPYVPPAPPSVTVVPSEFYTILAMAGAVIGFAIAYIIVLPSKAFRILKRLEKATAGRLRRVREPLVRYPPRIHRRARTTELAALKKLSFVMRKTRKRAKKEEISEGKHLKPAVDRRKKSAKGKRRPKS